MSLFRANVSTEMISPLRVQLRNENSPGFNAKTVVYSDSQMLLAANVTLGGLHRDMPEKELDLF